MQRRFILPLLVAAAVAACSSAPSRRYVQYADAYSAAVHSTADLVEGKKISAEDGRAIQGYLKIIRRRIDEFKEAIARGEDRKALNVLLDSISEALIEAQRQIAFAKDRGGD